MEKDKAMLPIKHHRALILAAVGLVAAASIWQAFFSPAADAEAHQPDFSRISHANIPEPPCTFWHDDTCETASSPPGLTTSEPYLPDDPHDLIPDASAAQRHFENLAAFAQLERWVNARITPDVSDLRAAIGGPDTPDGEVRLAITSDITGLPWVSDGQTEAEKITLDWLSVLQELNPTLVTSLVGMPFLQDHTPGDLQAIQVLTRISDRYDPQDATDLATLPGFADGGGIDNTEAKIIAVASMQYSDDDTFIERLADYGTVEEKTSAGQHGNTLTFAVVRVDETRQNSTLMQSAIIATQDVETLMGEAFPSDFMGILVADCPGCRGRTNGISIDMDDRFDQTDYDDYRQLLRTMAHEIGHFWWGAGTPVEPNEHENWVSEGAASYIGAYSVRSRFDDTDLTLSRWPCPYYRTIEHLRGDDPDYGSFGSYCNYALGERLFINLDRNMTAEDFTTSFRNFHQRLSTFEEDEIDQGRSLLRAFCSECEANPRDLGSSGYTLARYYGEKVLTDTDAPTGSISGLGTADRVSIQDYGLRITGFARVQASSPDPDLWVQLRFDNVVTPPDKVTIFDNVVNLPEKVTIHAEQYYEEREPYVRRTQERTVYYDEDDERAYIWPYLGAPDRRAPGHHWVYIYNEKGEKIAEAEYQVLP